MLLEIADNLVCRDASAVGGPDPEGDLLVLLGHTTLDSLLIQSISRHFLANGITVNPLVLNGVETTEVNIQTGTVITNYGMSAFSSPSSI